MLESASDSLGLVCGGGSLASQRSVHKGTSKRSVDLGNDGNDMDCPSEGSSALRITASGASLDYPHI